jgi:hypothetical protein
MVKAGYTGGFLRRLLKTPRTSLGLDINRELRLRIMSAMLLIRVVFLLLDLSLLYLGGGLTAMID